jgi:hypothetical protein
VTPAADRLRKLADQATPGPWAFEQFERGNIAVGYVTDDNDAPLRGAIGSDDGIVIDRVAEVERHADAELLALSPDLARWAADAADALAAQAKRHHYSLGHSGRLHKCEFPFCADARSLLARLDDITGDGA